MRKRPTPKCELVVERTKSTEGIQFIKLYPATNDARAFVENEAGDYGTLIPPTVAGDVLYQLFPTPLWDIDEVAAYLGSYNNLSDDG